MASDKSKELAAAKAKVARLEAVIASELRAELASLHAQFGYAKVNAFLAAVKAAAGGRPGRKSAAAKSAGPKRRKRAKITDGTRASVKKLVAEGKTGGAIAKALRISVPSVQNIKKALGLVRKTGK